MWNETHSQIIWLIIQVIWLGCSEVCYSKRKFQLPGTKCVCTWFASGTITEAQLCDLWLVGQKQKVNKERSFSRWMCVISDLKPQFLARFCELHHLNRVTFWTRLIPAIAKHSTSIYTKCFVLIKALYCERLLLQTVPFSDHICAFTRTCAHTEMPAHRFRSPLGAKIMFAAVAVKKKN